MALTTTNSATLARSLNTSTAMALREYLEAKMRAHRDDLERAPLAKVRHIQGQIEACRDLLEIAQSVCGAAHPGRR